MSTLDELLDELFSYNFCLAFVWFFIAVVLGMGWIATFVLMCVAMYGDTNEVVHNNVELAGKVLMNVTLVFSIIACIVFKKTRESCRRKRMVSRAAQVTRMASQRNQKRYIDPIKEVLQEAVDSLVLDRSKESVDLSKKLLTWSLLADQIARSMRAELDKDMTLRLSDELQEELKALDAAFVADRWKVAPLLEYRA